MPKLKNKILKSELINWQSIKDLQPNNLKDPRNLNYLKESLVKNGFSKAFDVWQSSEGEIYFVDGHTRSDVLKELVSDGYEIPEKLMCNFVNCKNRKEAVKILLEVHNQKQNKINDQVMNNWVEVEGVDIAEVSVESLNVDYFEKTDPDYSDKNKEINLKDLGNESSLVFKFNHQTYLNALDLLNNAKERLECNTNEETLLKLLSSYE